MKDLGLMLLQKNAFSEIVMGDTAIVRGMIESGVRVATSYPGSPTPEIGDAIHAIPLVDRPFYFEFSVNEKVATEVAYGASINGLPSCVFFKSVGLNVALDSLVQLSMMELIGGMVIVLGDDPGANSSQNEQDNRHIARLAYIPMFEPANPTEVYHMFLEAMKQSKSLKMPVFLRLTTHVCHAKEKVSFAGWENPPADWTPRFDAKNGPYVPITSAVFPLKRKALQRLREWDNISDTSAYHIIQDNKNPLRGVICSGLSYLSLMDSLISVPNKPDILKLGITYPLPKSKIVSFLKAHQEVKILEELDDVLEKEIKALAFENKIQVQILGKSSSEDWIGEYTPDKVVKLINTTWGDLITPISMTSTDFTPISPRPAQLCPGCGHRSAFYAIKKGLQDTDITVADIGCHSLGYLAPYEMGQMLLCMGHSSGTASGLSIHNQTRPVVAFLGDSTFFHAGIPGIINAIFNQHNFTLIILENGTTAMTGHQELPSTGLNFNQPTKAIPIIQLLQGLGIENIREIDTYKQADLTNAVKLATTESGFKVIIAKHPCMLKFTREQRRKGLFHPNQVMVDQEQCEKIHICVEKFACPTFQREENGEVHTEKDLCIGDGSCQQTCPAKALIQEKTQGGVK
jgi:indolepyruvate ferredoxin oxidoreductase alpha subunit